MRFRLKFNPGDRKLAKEEVEELKTEVPRIQYELKQRFGACTCSEHGAPEQLTTVIDTANFPDISFGFADLCCEKLNESLFEAAKS